MTIDKSLIDLFVKTTERGAYGASLFKGKNDKIGVYYEGHESQTNLVQSVLNKWYNKGC